MPHNHHNVYHDYPKDIFIFSKKKTKIQKLIREVLLFCFKLSFQCYKLDCGRVYYITMQCMEYHLES